MLGISDIPIVGKAVDRISDATVAAAFRGLRYLLCFNSIVNNLDSEIDKVIVQEYMVSSKAVAESANGKTILNHVTKWQKEVQEIKSRASELSKHRPSWNPLTRFRLGRKAAHEAKNVADLTLSGVDLLINEIAYLPPDENIPITDTAYQTFDSREDAYGKLWEALVKEDGHPIIGIYGMPGVGKTTMMEKVWKDAKEKKVFNKVTRGNVGAEKVDVIKLQNQIAGYLDCQFESKDNAERRASQLKSSLINAGKTLVVLDDVWDHIPLKNIGIPLGDVISKGCKILFTSRREDVCLRNDCKDPIKIEVLMADEAWDMFEKTVGASKIDLMHDKALARKVCKECSGLPLLIHSVGNAVKFASEDSWIDALYQLENCNLEEIDGIESSVYTCIKLSFDKLPEAEKTCLLLCSLFEEDTEIELEQLEELAIASQLINRGRTVRGLVDNLKSSSLLLEGETRGTVKLHDIIRDVARSIAARNEQYAFLFIRGGSYFPSNANYRTRKLLQVVESDNFQLPSGVVCPDLHTLWVVGNKKLPQFSKSFFEAIDNLKILLLEGMDIFPKQMSLPSFANLTILVLENCDLKETSLSLIPESLELISISKCCIPNPLNLSKLKCLRQLEVVCDNEIEMVENAKSSLPPSLVKLQIPVGFRICDAQGKISMPISWELNKLTALTGLSIRLEDSESCPAENLVANLHDFIIDVGNGWDRYDEYKRSSDLYTRSVLFKNTCIKGVGVFLVERAEQVILRYVKGLANGLGNSRRRRAFSTLKRLYIEECEEMEHLVAWKSQYEIQQSQPLSSFSNLTHLSIVKCRGLKYLFSAFVAKCLVQVEKLDISNCPRLEVVIRNESVIDDEVIINFPKLKKLKLRDLQSLKRFYDGEDRGSTTNAATTSNCLFHGLVVLPSIEKVSIEKLNSSEIWGTHCCSSNSFGGLKSLIIEGCHNLEYAVPLAMLPTFQNLEVLDITDCKSMRSVVESSSSIESSNAELPPLVALLSISLSHLPALTQLRFGALSRNLYPNIETLSINGCHSLRNVFLPSTVKNLAHLRKLYVNNCKTMSEIIGEEEEEKDGEAINEFVFPKLTQLILYFLPNFKSFCFSESVKALQRQSHMASKVSFPIVSVLELISLNTIKFEEIELGRNDSTSELKKLVVKSDKKLQLPSKWKLQFPNIEDLTLKNCWWHGNFCISNNRCIASGGGEVTVDRAEKVTLEDVKGSPSGFSNINIEAFSNMTKLSFDSCEGMEHVTCIPYYDIQQSPPLPSLSKLTELRINSCSGLKYLFSASVAKCLVELRLLHIENCPTLQVVVMNERTIHGVIIEFPKLKGLILANLQSLRNFCGECRVRNSGSTTIIDNTNASTAGSEPLFDGTVVFPSIEDLGIKYLNTSKIWGRNCCNDNSFGGLKSLIIAACPNLEIAIPLAMLPTFQNLQKLSIASCGSMSSEVESRSRRSSNESINPELLPLVALRSIDLFELPALTQTGLNSRRRNLYPNLQRLFIKECDSLRNLFPSSTAKDLLQLTELVVEKCKMVSEIIGEEEGDDDRNYEFVFPKLATLRLTALPNFKSFGFSESTEVPRHGSFLALKVSFPKLVELNFNLKTINLDKIELGKNDSTFKMTKLAILCDNKVQLPSKWKLHLPNIEDLSLKNCRWHGKVLMDRPEEVILKDVKGSPIGFSDIDAFLKVKKLSIESCDDIEHLARTPHYEIQQTQPLTCFSTLTSLKIVKCLGLKYLFCASVAKCLVQLQELHIVDCPTLEVVITNETGIDVVSINFPKLKTLILWYLESLRGFYGENRGRSLSPTTIMENAAISSNESESLFDGRVTLPALEKLDIAALKMSAIWKKNCYKDNSFSELKLLRIHGCQILEFAIPLAMLPTFDNLEQLAIMDCISMTSDVESSSKEYSDTESEKILVALRFLSLSKLPAMTQTRLNSRRRNLYPNLERLEIQGCERLRNVFLHSTAKDLLHLRELFVTGCKMMSEVVGEEEKLQGNDELVFPELTRIVLKDLPNFINFCFNKSVEPQVTSDGHQLHLAAKVWFPKLVELHVSVKTIKLDEIELGRNDSTFEMTKLAVWCDKKVQLPSVWQLRFPNIEELSLKNCSWHGKVLMDRAEEVILKDVKGSPTGFSNTDAFSKTKKLSIESCDEMEHLARTPHYEIQRSQQLTCFSTLTSLKIVKCLGLTYLFCTSVAECLVQLQELHVENCPTLELVIMNESRIDAVIVNFPKLITLTLWNLECMRRFCGENSGRSSSPTTIMENATISPAVGYDSLFDGMVTFPALENLGIQNLKTSEIWGRNCYKNKSFCQLKFLKISGCPNLAFAIPLAMLPTFQNLKVLDIFGCNSLISEVESSGTNEGSNQELTLVTISSIQLVSLPAITQTRLNTRRNLYPNLETLKIWGCKSMRNVFLPSIAKDLVHLKELDVQRCEMMSEIIGEEGDEEKNNELVFPELNKLVLFFLPNIKSFCFSDFLEARATTEQHLSYSKLKVSFLKLVELHLNVKAIKLDEIIELGKYDSTYGITKLAVWYDNKVQLPFKWQLQFPDIEELSLKNCWWHGKVVDRAEEVMLKDVKGSPIGFSNTNIEAFSKLKKLSIESCDDMEHLPWMLHCEIQHNQPLTSFSTLTSLKIIKCLELKYLLCASVANCLVHLQELHIVDCPTLEVVIMNESRIDVVIMNFPKLITLILWNLESLTGFTGENRGRNSSPTTITENAVISCVASESLFDGTVAFPALEKLEIAGLETSKIWKKNCYKDNSFRQLKLLIIHRCQNLEFAIPSTMLPRFQNMEILDIMDCKSMSSDVEISSKEYSDAEAQQMLVALQSIYLSKLPVLTQTRLNSRRINLYPNLRRIQIQDCERLRNVFLPSIAKDLLHLTELFVAGCKTMCEIIGTEEKQKSNDELVFPELTRIAFKDLPSLKNFCFNKFVEAQATSDGHQLHLPIKVSFPKLAVLEFDLKTIKFDEIEVGRNDFISEIKKLVVKSDNKLQLPSQWKLQFPNIEDLTLKNCWWHENFCIFTNRCLEGGGKILVDRAEEMILEDVEGSPNGFSYSDSNIQAFSNMKKVSIQSCEDMQHVACIPHFEIQQSQPHTAFSKLTSLEINKCSGLKYLFSASVAKCLVELQVLHIENCPILEVVIRNDGVIHGVIIFPKLRSLMLWNLESLRRFYGETRGKTSGSTTIMENAAISPDASECPVDGMVSFPNIEILKFNVNGSPNCFRNSNSNIAAFPNLKKLFIRSSEDIEHLACIPQYEIQQSQPVTPFSNLSKLFIHKLSGLKYLLCASVAKCLVHLQELCIIDCPTLEVVIRNESATDEVIIKLPKLKQLRLYSLPSLTSFYRGNRGTSSSSTTIMEKASISSDASEPMFDGMVAFPALELLGIKASEISKIWGRTCYKSNSFGRLKIIELLHCRNLEFAIPPAMLPTLQNLERLFIQSCDSMASEVESSNSSNESSNLELPKLVVLHLSNLPALTQTRLNSRKRNLYPNLQKLIIMDCNGLRNVFLPSIAKELVHLWELFVAGCKMMSEIIGKEENGERNYDLVFPELTIIHLKDLPSFKSFCFKESAEAQAASLLHQFHIVTKVSFPKLLRLEFCLKTITLDEIELCRSDSTSKLKKLEVRCSEEVQLPYRWQLQLPTIEELYLESSWWHGDARENNVEHFVINPHGTSSFQSLKVVEVGSCGLFALFSCSVFRNLHQLQKLKVKDCPLLEEVVREDVNVVGTSDDTISLLKLESIELKYLPKLKSFSGSASHAFNFPALKSIVLHNCPQMENFTCLEISTQAMPDFNSQIEQYLSNPNEGTGEDSSDAGSNKVNIFDFDLFMEERFDANSDM